MKAKSVNNNLVGRKVMIDWPCRWQGAQDQFKEQLKAEAKAKEHYYGETGEIVAYNPAEESGKSLAIVLDNSKEVVHLFDGAVTITSVSPREQDHAQIVDLLQQILEATKANSPMGG